MVKASLLIMTAFLGELEQLIKCGDAMSRRVRGPLGLLVIIIMAGCGEDTSDQQGTAATTQALLSQPIGELTQVKPSPALEPSSGEDELPIALLGYDQGNQDALVRIVEMSDYGCGYCRKFHLETFPILREEFIETGKVLWKFVPFVNGMFENSLFATEAAECALEQGSLPFEALNERLWSDQASWKRSNDPEPVLRSMAQDAGVDLTEFDAWLNNDPSIDRIASARSTATRLGVRGTPTFYPIGFPPIEGALPTEAFQQVLELMHQQISGAAGN